MPLFIKGNPMTDAFPHQTTPTAERSFPGDVLTVDGRTKVITISRQEAVDLIAGLVGGLAGVPVSNSGALGIPSIRWGNDFNLHIHVQ
jgi:hypothetical protein